MILIWPTGCQLRLISRAYQPFSRLPNKGDLAHRTLASLIRCRVCSGPQANLAIVQNALPWPERTVRIKQEAPYRKRCVTGPKAQPGKVSP